MNAELKRNKQEIRNWIKQWDDQRLAHVYCHNRDGKMRLMDPCGCILGVTLAGTVHARWESECGHKHYEQAKNLPGADAVENAYQDLASVAGVSQGDIFRCLRMSPILRAELRRRDRIRASKMVESQDAVELVLA